MSSRLSLHSKLQEKIQSIGQNFIIDGVFIEGAEIEAGHINSTYVASYRECDGRVKRYVLQRINGFVFKDPIAVVSNVERVTRHISAKASGSGAQTLALYSTHEGAFHVVDEDGGIWRCYNFIEGCRSYDVVENAHQAYEAARAFGRFQNSVSDLNVEGLKETIPDFHNTPKRFQRLLEVAALDPKGRLGEVEAELAFIRERESLCGHLVALMESGELPARITHNDTKLNNVMMDSVTDEAVCVIDLDTVMPGLTAHDFGDLVRTATSSSAEDERDLTKVEMRMPMFEAIARGYVEACPILTTAEIENLVAGSKVITLEVAMRFLTDHLEGDVYFNAEREGQNLDRARVHIELLKQIERQELEMQSFIAGLRGKRS